MPSRRKIRETVVQFLYCADLEGGADPNEVAESFWEFVNESSQRKLLSAVFRMVHHLAQGRDERLKEWNQRQQAAMTALSAWPEAESVGLVLQRMARSEAKWSACYEKLQRVSLDGEDAVVISRLESKLEELFKIDRGLEQTRHEFFQLLEDFPQLSGSMEPIAASTRRLQRISDRLRMVENPHDFPEQTDLAKLRDSKSEMKELRDRSTELIAQVAEHKAAADVMLADVIENFAPERIDPVDRAILRLAVYELKHTETPSKVILNEAVEIAKRFGTTDSSRFVNGVLDKIASQPADN